MLQILQLESLGGTLLLQCLLFHRLKKLELPFRVRSSFLLFASLLLADLLVGGDMTGKVDLKWDTVNIVFCSFFWYYFLSTRVQETESLGVKWVIVSWNNDRKYL